MRLLTPAKAMHGEERKSKRKEAGEGACDENINH